jgi:hypothetical protein
MDLTDLCSRLEYSGQAIRQLLSDVPEEQMRWRPAAKKWSLLIVACHLADEERDDFRTRVDHTLHDQDIDWPPIDPEAWVVSREYEKQAPADSVRRWVAEREASLAWLATLSSPDWSRTFQHPRAGLLRAGDVMASWLAHDLLHLRQITKLHYLWVQQLARPYSTDYAGGW